MGTVICVWHSVCNIMHKVSVCLIVRYYVVSRPFRAHYSLRANQHACALRSSNQKQKKYLFCINIDRTAVGILQMEIIICTFPDQLAFCLESHLR